MDPSLLENPYFWADPGPLAAGDFPGEIPDIPELRGHVLFETSGSSGVPKWISLSKQALLVSAAAVNRHLGVTEDSVWGLALPVRHVGGFGVLARAFEAAAESHVFPGRWDAREFVRWLADKRVTHTSLVPTQVHDLVAARAEAPASITAIVVGGGMLGTETGRAARALGWPVLASYGMTETCSQVATQGPEVLDMPYEAAPLPLLPVWRAACGDDGRLRLAGPALFSGVLERADGRWEYRARESEWHVTSDRVALENGGITPLGRADLLIKILGELVDPEEVERELSACSGGALVAGSFVVSPVPDSRTGHRLTPVFEDSADRQAVHHALSLYHAQAPGFRRLEPPVFVKKLPRGGLGKIRRGEVAELLRR